MTALSRRSTATANLIQAQRDYFGARTPIKRTDKEGVFHTEWLNNFCNV